MTALRIETDASGVLAVLRSLEADLSSGFERPLRQAAQTISRDWELAFRNSGAGAGRSAWAPVAAATLRGRERSVAGPRPLVDTGRGRAGLLATRPGVPESAFELTPESLTMGTTRPDWPRHQRGGAYEPARPLPLLEGGVPEQIEGHFAEDLRKRVQAAEKGGSGSGGRA